MMNTLEKELREKKPFTILLEDLRCMSKFRIDSLYVKPEHLTESNIETIIKGKNSINFSFVSNINIPIY